MRKAPILYALAKCQDKSRNQNHGGPGTFSVPRPPVKYKEIFDLTTKENAFRKCALMILHDQCPPERKHYLCMKVEDDSAADCTQCWDNYLWGLAAGTVELPNKGWRAAV